MMSPILKYPIFSFNLNSLFVLVLLRTLFAPNSSLGEQIKGAYMPSWALLGMTAVEERVREIK